MYQFVSVLDKLINFYEVLIIVYCLFTWIPRQGGGLLDDIFSVLESICAPYLNLFRRIIPPMGGMDFSPVIAIIALNLLERLVVGILL